MTTDKTSTDGYLRWIGFVLVGLVLQSARVENVLREGELLRQRTLKALVDWPIAAKGKCRHMSSIYLFVACIDTMPFMGHSIERIIIWFSFFSLKLSHRLSFLCPHSCLLDRWLYKLCEAVTYKLVYPLLHQLQNAFWFTKNFKIVV